MYQNIKVFPGCVLLLLLKSSTLTVDGINCKSSTIKHKNQDVMYQDCSVIPSGFQKFEQVPTNLPLEVVVLDLSHQSLVEINENSFAKYVNLEILRLNGSKANSFNSDSFKSLKKLEELNICGFSPKWGGNVNMPPSLNHLTACKKKVELNFVDFANLKYADLSDCDLNQFPNFNIKAPLDTVILDTNLMNELKVDQLAPYCSIKKLSLNLKFNSELLTQAKYCDCVRLNVWMSQFDISGEPLKCKSEEDLPCDKEFHDDILSQRRTCLGESTRPIDTISTQSSSQVVIGVVAVLVILTLIMLAIAVRYVKSRKAPAIESDLSDESISDESTTADENVVEEEPSE